MKTIEDIFRMKEEEAIPFPNRYEWFFRTLEDNALSKADGTDRNVSLVDGYDLEAQAFIVHQLYRLNEDAAADLMRALGIAEPFVSDEHASELIDI